MECQPYKLLVVGQLHAGLGVERIIVAVIYLMTETLSGVAMLVVGLLIAIFSSPLARLTIDFNKRMLGVELPFNWSRIATLIIGALLSFSGVLKLLRLPAF